MSTIYTPANAYHSSITVPSPGDGRTASSVNTPIEAIADNAAWANARLSGAFRLVAISATINPGTVPGWGALGAYDTQISHTPGPVLIATYAGGVAGDVIITQAAISLQTGSGGGAPYSIRLEHAEGAATFTTGDANSQQQFNGASLGTWPGVGLLSVYGVQATGTVGIYINAHETGTGAPQASLAMLSGSFVYMVYRAN